MTTVSGILRDTQKNPLPGLDVTVRYTKPLAGWDDGAAVQTDRFFETDLNGLLTMDDLVPGHYRFVVFVPSNEDTTLTVPREATMTVQDVPTMTLEEALDEPFFISLKAAAAIGAAAQSAASANRAQAWAESPTPPDPDDATSKSSKTWAGESEGSADAAAASASTATTQAGIATTQAGNAASSATQAELAALAAGAPIVTTLTSPVPADETVEILFTDGTAQVWEVVAGVWTFRGNLADDAVRIAGPDSDIQIARFAERYQRIESMFKAEGIRRRAGCPPGVRVGPRGTPGLSDVGALTVVSEPTAIASSGDAAALADSGTGTYLDPYVIRDKDFSRSTSVTATDQGVTWSDVDADYHIKFINCRFRGWRNGQIRIVGPSNVTLELENCELDASFNTANVSVNDRLGIQNNAVAQGPQTLGSGTRIITRLCKFTGGAGSNLSQMYVQGRDCEFYCVDYTAVNKVIFCGGNDLSNPSGDLGFPKLDMRRGDYTEWDLEGQSGLNNAPFQLGVDGLEFNIERMDFRTGGNISTTLIRSVAGSNVRFPARRPPRGTIRFIKTEENSERYAWLLFGDGIKLEYCDFFRSTSITRRGIEIGEPNVDDPDRIVRHVHVYRCHLTRDQAGTGATCEDVLGYHPESLIVEETWTEHLSTGGDDVYENYGPQGACQVINSVGDNIRRQIVDAFDDALNVGAFKPFAESQFADGIYGDCKEEVVQLTGVQSAVVSGLFAATTNEGTQLPVNLADRAAVMVYSRFAERDPKNVHIIGPVPLLENIGGGAGVYSLIVTDGPTPAADAVKRAYLEGDTLVTDGLTEAEKARLRVR